MEAEPLILYECYMGRCDACGGDIYVDSMLGEEVRHVAGGMVCENCYQEMEYEMQEWECELEERDEE